MRRDTASIVLDCHAGGCTLSIQTPYSFVPRNSSSGIPIKTKKRSKRKTTIELTRDQLVRADNIKWDPSSQEIVENYGSSSPTYTNNQRNNDDEGGDGSNKHKKAKQKKYKKKNYSYGTGGPDLDGNYDSYVIILRDPLPPEGSNEEAEEDDPEESPSMKMARKMSAQHKSMTDDPNSLASLLAPYAVNDGGNKVSNTQYIIHPRDFNLGKTRRLARTAVSKINAYTKGRRASCILRESRPVAWQGLVLLILGIFSFVLCLLLGQFWDEYDPTKSGSYRKRMAEIRKREEAKKQRLRNRTNGRKSPLKRPGAQQPSSRRPTSGISSGRSTASTVSRTSAAGTSTVRARPNAGANKSNTGGDSWMGSVGGVAHGYSKRAY